MGWLNDSYPNYKAISSYSMLQLHLVNQMATNGSTRNGDAIMAGSHPPPVRQVGTFHALLMPHGNLIALPALLVTPNRSLPTTNGKRSF